MGGSIGEGNTTVSAEFNIYADPEAADVVFRSRRADHDDGPRRDPPGAARPRVRGGAAGARHDVRPRSPPSSPSTRSTGTCEWSGATTTAIHDAVAVAHLAVPDLVAVAPYHVAVDTTDGPARGRTVCDGLPYRLRRDGRTPNAEVGILIDRGRFERSSSRRSRALP